MSNNEPVRLDELWAWMAHYGREKPTNFSMRYLGTTRMNDNIVHTFRIVSSPSTLGPTRDVVNAVFHTLQGVRSEEGKRFEVWVRIEDQEGISPFTRDTWEQLTNTPPRSDPITFGPDTITLNAAVRAAVFPTIPPRPTVRAKFQEHMGELFDKLAAWVSPASGEHTICMEIELEDGAGESVLLLRRKFGGVSAKRLAQEAKDAR